MMTNSDTPISYPVERSADTFCDSAAMLASWLFEVPAVVIHLPEQEPRGVFYGRDDDLPGDILVALALNYPAPDFSAGSREIIVRDTAKDAYFRAHPLPQPQAPVRFFLRRSLAGQDGTELGALYLFDTKDRPDFSLHERTLLWHFAAHIADRTEAVRSFHFRDRLTGLGNRGQFVRDAAASLARPARHDAALWAAVIDIYPLDSISMLVVAVGLTRVEHAIQLMADRMAEALPPHFTAYRLGLTRFGFFCEGCLDDIRRLALACVEKFDSPITVDDLSFSLSAFGGVMPVEQDEIAQLIGALFAVADTARANLQPVSVFDKQVILAQRRHVLIINSIRGAMAATDQLRLVYQPRARLSDGKWISVEALLRWRHPTLGEIPPAELIAVIEDTTLMPLLTDWVLKNAMSQLGQWQRLLPSLKMSINISESDLKRPNFDEWVCRVMELHGINGTSLELELTESSLVRCEQVVFEMLDSLARRGIEIAIDDFGAGYSNLSKLSGWSFDVLKIDNALVRAVANSERAATIVRSVIVLAKQLGHRVVAEGVETEQLRDLAEQWGCDEVQGYFIARPMEAALMSEALATRRDEDLALR